MLFVVLANACAPAPLPPIAPPTQQNLPSPITGPSPSPTLASTRTNTQPTFGSPTIIFNSGGGSKPTILPTMRLPTADSKPSCNTCVFDIAFQPPSPAAVKFHSRVTIFFKYTSNEAGGIVISTKPLANGNMPEQAGFSLSPVYPAGGGATSSFFTVHAGDVTIDQVRFELWTADLRRKITESLVPVNYHFSN